MRLSPSHQAHRHLHHTLAAAPARPRYQAPRLDDGWVTVRAQGKGSHNYESGRLSCSVASDVEAEQCAGGRGYGRGEAVAECGAVRSEDVL
jgi:hypothetical protein